MLKLFIQKFEMNAENNDNQCYIADAGKEIPVANQICAKGRLFGRNIENIQVCDSSCIEIANLKNEEKKSEMPPENDQTNIEPYTDEIEAHIRRLETEYMVKSNYMVRQPQINEKMRAILLDWIAEVHLKFKLLPGTLYLSASIVDRVLEKIIVVREELQLIGVTALFIAGKYEEVYPPEANDYVNKRKQQRQQQKIKKTIKKNKKEYIWINTKRCF